MAGFITFLHVCASILLIISILMQSGKGGGLAEGFNSAENLLGAQTNVVMIRVTTTIALIFLVTSLTLAVLSTKKERSLMADLPDTKRTASVNIDKLFDQAPSQTITINAAGASTGK
ncbi:MAG: preprotein translocase subunit SecG [Candidatus Omnitrophica bacterium]|nr:preprotein translocase subunit SecG [Candidatus Omnitrophota bacterium]